MNELQEAANEYKQFLEETQKWIDSNIWRDLPYGLRRVIVRGQCSLEDAIKDLEKMAKEETAKA